MNKEEMENRLRGICQDCVWLEKIEPMFYQLQQENKQLKEQLDKYERLIEYLKSLDFYESELDYDYEEKPVSNYYPADMVYHISKMSNIVEILERMK